MCRLQETSKALLYVVLAFCAGLAAAQSALAITGDKPELVKLAEDTYAFVGKQNDANAMFVVTKQGVVLIDTGHEPIQSRELQANIAKITDQPVRYVVLTQNHADHVGGAPLFSPPATVIIHERIARDWAQLKPYQIKSWRKRFTERTDALAGLSPLDTAVTFNDRMKLHIGGKNIELIYVDDPHNPGDIAVWLPDGGIMHAGFVGYLDRHPDIRPDYSHGTTMGMLKQLEVLSALKPKVMVPSHGPLGSTKDLIVLQDYLLLARSKVRTMMAAGLGLPEIEKKFEMNEQKDWDRKLHFLQMGQAIHRELLGLGPEIEPMTEHNDRVTILTARADGLYLTARTDNGREVRLRASVWCNIEGLPNRTAIKPGMRAAVQYMVPASGKAPQGFEIMEAVFDK